MSAMKRAGLVGVTGYTGMELTRLLAGHGGLELVRATSRSEAGAKLSSLYPFLHGTRLADLTVTRPDITDLAENCDIVFLAVPHATAMDMAGQLLDAGARVVDLSADFRLRDPAVYQAWYKHAHTRTDILPQAVYGLVELYREQARQARLIANPGCYPSAVVLALYPALAQGLVETGDMVIDAKSGATGAGRKAAVGSLFCEVSDSFKAYNLAKHRHTPEIEQELSRLAGQDIALSFNTHLLPINRGILSTIYTKLRQPTDMAAVRAAYDQHYAGERWIRLLPEGELPQTRNVRGTMFCDIGLVLDPRTNRLIVVSAIDNLCRGASGQALANANLMLGLPETMGLDLVPLAP